MQDMSATYDLSVLSDASDSVPWERLEALAQAAAGDRALFDRLREEWADLMLTGKAYEEDDFRAIYYPFVMSEAARQGSAEMRREAAEQLLDQLMICSADDDEGMLEYLPSCLEALPIEDVAPLVLELLKEDVDAIESLESIYVWSLLERVRDQGSAELREQTCAAALAALQRAEREGLTGPGVQMASYRLGELKCEGALELMQNAERRLRKNAKNIVTTIDANGVKDAIQILKGESEPYINEKRTLREMVEDERKLYADWYKKRGEEVEEEAESDDDEWDDVLPAGGARAKFPDSGFEPRQMPIRNEGKVGRNEPCPCGSGKKYKKCCGK